ncbi:hypothetical protein MY3296_005731 [Beauveria thailandica]
MASTTAASVSSPTLKSTKYALILKLNSAK